MYRYILSVSRSVEKFLIKLNYISSVTKLQMHTLYQEIN